MHRTRYKVISIHQFPARQTRFTLHMSRKKPKWLVHVRGKSDWLFFSSENAEGIRNWLVMIITGLERFFCQKKKLRFFFSPTIWWWFNFYGSKKLWFQKEIQLLFFFPTLSPDRDNRIFLSLQQLHIMGSPFISHSMRSQSSWAWSYYTSQNHCQKEVRRRV